jgi:hypothetical protein
MAGTPVTDIGALVVADEGYAKPQSLTDDTYIVGAEINLQPAGAAGYRSALVIAPTCFTSSSGASGGKVTITLAVYHDTVTGMGSEALLDSDTYEYTWAADGANTGVHCLPVSFETANQFVRAKFKQTKAGTITVSNAYGAIVVVLGGMVVTPDAGYAAAGYENTTEAS